MKRSFFITLAIYTALAAALWWVDFESLRKGKKEVRVISLASLGIKAPAAAPAPPPPEPTLPEPTPPEPTPPEPEPEPTPPPPKKEAPKPKKIDKPKPKPKKIVKKPRKKPKKKVVKKVVKKSPPKPPKKPLQKPAPEPQKLAALQTTAQEAPKADLPRGEPEGHKSAPKKSGAPAGGQDYSKAYTDRFAAQLRSAIARHKFYPRTARRRGMEGVVKVYFELTPQRQLRTLRVVRSSGHAVLDKAALKCIRSACREFPAPMKCVEVTVPIEYRLK